MLRLGAVVEVAHTFSASESRLPHAQCTQAQYMREVGTTATTSVCQARIADLRARLRSLSQEARRETDRTSKPPRLSRATGRINRFVARALHAHRSGGAQPPSRLAFVLPCLASPLATDGFAPHTSGRGTHEASRRGALPFTRRHYRMPGRFLLRRLPTFHRAAVAVVLLLLRLTSGCYMRV